jgi:hypothetical protein
MSRKGNVRALVRFVPLLRAALEPVPGQRLPSGAHDHTIIAAEAKSLGPPTATDTPESVLELTMLYPRLVRVQGGGGEYLLVHRNKELAKPSWRY